MHAPLPRPLSTASGLHLTGDLHGCARTSEWMYDKTALRQRCIDLCTEAGLRVVGDAFHSFGEGLGVTGTVLLAESHLAIHTWPESGNVTLDVFVCNHSGDNRDKAALLFDQLAALFAARRVVRQQLERGPG